MPFLEKSVIAEGALGAAKTEPIGKPGDTPSGVTGKLV